MSKLGSAEAGTGTVGWGGALFGDSAGGCRGVWMFLERFEIKCLSGVECRTFDKIVRS